MLDSKTRIIDTIITEEGKRQLAAGTFKPIFYSFSDASAVYSPADISVSGSSPEQNTATIVAFEAMSLPQDQVAFESDDAGNLAVFNSKNNYFQVPSYVSTDVSQSVLRIIGGSLVQGWNLEQPTQVTSSVLFSSLANSILSGSADNFRRLGLLQSPDLLYPNRNAFKLSTNSLTFSIDDQLAPAMVPGGMTAGILEATEDMFADKHLSHADAFQFLPPVNKLDNSPNVTGVAIGNYFAAIQGLERIETVQDLVRSFKQPNGSGNLPRQTVTFSETTTTNRLMCQVFEVGGAKLSKLDIVDFGVFSVARSIDPNANIFPEAVASPVSPDASDSVRRIHVYFLGKVYADSITGANKFVNIATLVFQS
jgi:hypothetical protein